MVGECDGVWFVLVIVRHFRNDDLRNAQSDMFKLQVVSIMMRPLMVLVGVGDWIAEESIENF